MVRFIGAEVEVRREGPLGPPLAFTWEGREHAVAEVIERRRELDFKAAWWRRRHRDHFRVRTTEGRTFDLYFHRGPGRRYWVLWREL